MKLESDTLELIQAEVMKRVFEPVDDDVPDPSCYFEACLSLIASRVQQRVAAIPKAERRDWFIDRAMEMHGWCVRAKAPDVLTERIEAWLARLNKGRQRRS